MSLIYIKFVGELMSGGWLVGDLLMYHYLQYTGSHNYVQFIIMSDFYCSLFLTCCNQNFEYIQASGYRSDSRCLSVWIYIRSLMNSLNIRNWVPVFAMLVHNING